MLLCGNVFFSESSKIPCKYTFLPSCHPKNFRENKGVGMGGCAVKLKSSFVFVLGGRHQVCQKDCQAKKGPFFWNLIFFFKSFFSNHHSSTTIKHHHIFLNIILQTHIFKVSTARLFRLGSVNARVGLIFLVTNVIFFLFLLLKQRVD